MAEVVQPRKLPDGLLEVRFAGGAKPGLVLVEIATYPEPRVVAQIQDDIRLVRQARGVLPEAVVLCLCPRGQYRVPEQAEEKSPVGWTVSTLKWKVVEVWTLSAEELLAAPDVAVAACASLARYDGPPEVLLQRCRDRIDRDGGKHTANLLAVAQVFAKLHFDKPEWLDILGGRKMIIETPLIQEIGAEFTQAATREEHPALSDGEVPFGDAHSDSRARTGEGRRAPPSSDGRRRPLPEPGSVREATARGTACAAPGLDPKQAPHAQTIGLIGWLMLRL